MSKAQINEITDDLASETSVMISEKVFCPIAPVIKPLDDLLDNIPDFSLSSSFEDIQDYGSSTHFEVEIDANQKYTSNNMDINNRDPERDQTLKANCSRATEAICSIKQISTSSKFSIRKHLKTSNFSKVH